MQVVRDLAVTSSLMLNVYCAYKIWNGRAVKHIGYQDVNWRIREIVNRKNGWK